MMASQASPPPQASVTGWKAIILAGGSGTRLHPVTREVCKQLLPVYDKPLIYYPLSVLMLAGLRDILIISTPKDLDRFQGLLGEGTDLGLRLSYLAQPRPEGLAQAFILGADFIGADNCCLILGDNIFYGHGLQKILQRALTVTQGGVIFGYWVKDPQRYGVVEFDPTGRVLGIEEKPQHPKSHYAVPGLYFYDNQVLEIAANLKPSARGELEITDVNRVYLEQGKLFVERLGRGVAWLDAGTHESLLQAANFVQAVEDRQGWMISSPEEIAYRMGYISREQLIRLGQAMENNQYGQYLLQIANSGYAL